jgi:UDP-N-acetylglucosamine--N-acetylmuramyl-(pentapeptide) pyrophosphoryl-undecaprenol N-acetylglucosamine transferase
MTNYLLTGGGTAGHVNPLLALADAITYSNENAKVLALGTAEGLETRLVVERGYELATIAKLPFPRRLNAYAFRFPARFAAAVAQTRTLLKQRKIDVVVGFGGYASAPAYLAAVLERVPLVIHEANALPGMANKLGAGIAKAIGVAFKSTPLRNAQFVGMPLRKEIEALASKQDKAAARAFFGLDPESFTLLVTGGSLGAKKINDVIDESRDLLIAAGIQVLHIVGGNSELASVKQRGYVRISYCDRMDLAISAADFAVSRAGASTVSEFSAVGLPALYIPYAVGNGEQALNIKDLLAVEAAISLPDSKFSRDFVATELVPLLSSTKRILAMSQASKTCGTADGTARLLALVQGVLSAEKA